MNGIFPVDRDILSVCSGKETKVYETLELPV